MNFTQSIDNSYMIPTSISVGSGEPTDIRCVCDTVEDFKSFLDATGMELRYEGLITYEKTNKMIKVYKGDDVWEVIEKGEGVDLSTYATKAELNDINTKLANQNILNIKDYGAIGNWSSNPASKFYSSLEELQKDYPKAQSLNDEMDTLALEKALGSSARTVYIPYGGYKLNRGNFSIGSDRSIVGDSKGVTQITYSGNDEYVFVLNGNNVTMKDFRISAPFTSGEKGTKTTTSCINASGRTNNTFSDLYIVGFDRALNFNIGSWIQYINRVRIQNCNYGIYGSSEFNNICISQCSITYCDIAIYAAAGRNIAIQMCDIERNNTGVYKTNLGDISIRDNYFEFNTSGNIEVAWGTNSVDMAIIDGNTFFTTSSGEPMIKYHTRADAHILVTNNNFHCYNLSEGTQVKCLVPTHSNTQVRPYFKNNFLRKGYVIGVDLNKLNGDEFYKNGNHVYYSSKTDLSAVMTPLVQTIRVPFTDGGVITLPSFSSFEDNTQCFKIFAFANSNTSTTDDQYMTIDTNGKAIYGIRKIHANQIYSIYFNRVNGNTEELIVVKG